MTTFEEKKLEDGVLAVPTDNDSQNVGAPEKGGDLHAVTEASQGRVLPTPDEQPIDHLVKVETVDDDDEGYDDEEIVEDIVMVAGQPNTVSVSAIQKGDVDDEHAPTASSASEESAASVSPAPNGPVPPVAKPAVKSEGRVAEDAGTETNEVASVHRLQTEDADTNDASGDGLAAPASTAVGRNDSEKERHAQATDDNKVIDHHSHSSTQGKVLVDESDLLDKQRSSPDLLSQDVTPVPAASSSADDIAGAAQVATISDKGIDDNDQEGPDQTTTGDTASTLPSTGTHEAQKSPGGPVQTQATTEPDLLSFDDGANYCATIAESASPSLTTKTQQLTGTEIDLLSLDCAPPPSAGAPNLSASPVTSPAVFGAAEPDLLNLDLGQPAAATQAHVPAQDLPFVLPDVFTDPLTAPSDPQATNTTLPTADLLSLGGTVDVLVDQDGDAKDLFAPSIAGHEQDAPVVMNPTNFPPSATGTLTSSDLFVATDQTTPSLASIHRCQETVSSTTAAVETASESVDDKTKDTSENQDITAPVVPPEPHPAQLSSPRTERKQNTSSASQTHKTSGAAVDSRETGADVVIDSALEPVEQEEVSHQEEPTPHTIIESKPSDEQDIVMQTIDTKINDIRTEMLYETGEGANLALGETESKDAKSRTEDLTAPPAPTVKDNAATCPENPVKISVTVPVPENDPPSDNRPIPESAPPREAQQSEKTVFTQEAEQEAETKASNCAQLATDPCGSCTVQ